VSRLPAAAILGQAPVGRPGADHAADLVRGASQSPKSLPSTLSSSLMSSWNAGSSALALLPAKRLPFLATALQGVGAENAVTASDLDSLDK